MRAAVAIQPGARFARPQPPSRQLLAAWPVPRQAGWIDHVNAPQTELSAIRRSVQRGMPLGDPGWTQRVVRKLGLESTLRPRGRPKTPDNGS